MTPARIPTVMRQAFQTALQTTDTSNTLTALLARSLSTNIGMVFPFPRRETRK